jgi:hypothetical protein
MKIISIISPLLFLSLATSVAQQKNISFDLTSSVGYITPGHVPFWLRSNQFGSIPLDNGSLSFIGGLHKEYQKSNPDLVDWGFSVEGRANIGHKSNFTMIDGFGKVRISIFEIRVGRSREIMGLCDTSLTSGAWAVSGTALGIPKIQISIPEFYTLPFFGRLFAFKGNYAHGWFGKTSQPRDGNILEIPTYLHQKSLYGRFGKPEWKWKLYGGFNHQVQWGNEKDYWGEFYNLSPFKTYLYVITGHGWQGSRMGNSLGSIDLGGEYEFKNIKILAYRQNLYDAGALIRLANIRDGLNGLSLENKLSGMTGIQWKKILVEVLYTKNQAGEPWSPKTKSGDEEYFNHYQYIQGWSYKSVGIGNPFITPRSLVRDGLPFASNEFFVNNRVVAFHFGFEGSLQKWDFILKSSYSLNYGTYNTSFENNTSYGIFGTKKQFSAYLDAGRELKNGLRVGLTGALDVGELYYNSVGVMVRVGKTF